METGAGVATTSQLPASDVAIPAPGHCDEGSIWFHSAFVRGANMGVAIAEVLLRSGYPRPMQALAEAVIAVYESEEKCQSDILGDVQEVGRELALVADDVLDAYNQLDRTVENMKA